MKTQQQHYTQWGEAVTTDMTDRERAVWMLKAIITRDGTDDITKRQCTFVLNHIETKQSQYGPDIGEDGEIWQTSTQCFQQSGNAGECASSKIPSGDAQTST